MKKTFIVKFEKFFTNISIDKLLFLTISIFIEIDKLSISTILIKVDVVDKLLFLIKIVFDQLLLLIKIFVDKLLFSIIKAKKLFTNASIGKLLFSTFVKINKSPFSINLIFIEIDKLSFSTFIEIDKSSSLFSLFFSLLSRFVRRL